MCAVAEHPRGDPLHALGEAARALRPGGALFLQAPNAYSACHEARFVTGRGLFRSAPGEFVTLGRVGHMGHIREYTRAEVAGVGQISVELSDALPRCRLRPAGRIAGRAPSCTAPSPATP